MKISIKLKYSELISLVEYLEATIDTEECEDRMEAIVTTLMVKLYVKLKTRVIVVDKPKMTIGIEPETAMAFVEYFEGYPIQSFSHAGNIIQRMIAEFDKATTLFYSPRSWRVRSIKN